MPSGIKAPLPNSHLLPIEDYMSDATINAAIVYDAIPQPKRVPPEPIRAQGPHAGVQGKETNLASSRHRAVRDR